MGYNSHRIVSYGPYELAFDVDDTYLALAPVVVSGDDVIPAGAIITDIWLQNFDDPIESLWSNITNDLDLEAFIVSVDGGGVIADWFQADGDLNGGGPTGGVSLKGASGGFNAILVLNDSRVGFAVYGDNPPTQGRSEVTLMVLLPE